METSKAILVELEKFLFNSEDYCTPTLSVHQKINQEAKELLLDMQEYTNIIGIYNSKGGTSEALKSRLESEGLKFARIISTSASNYLEMKKIATWYYSDVYAISCYIDETEESPWHRNKNLHRLKF
jgi:hypothetical protein